MTRNNTPVDGPIPLAVKRSIITQETDIQVSTHNASSIEKHMFDASPKLQHRDSSPNKNSTLKAGAKSIYKDRMVSETIATEFG